MSDRIAEGGRHMAASTRCLLDEHPLEGRLLFHVIVSDIVFFFSRSLKPPPAPTAAAAAQAAGGVGSARDTRAAVFWAATVSAPFGLMASVLAVILSRGDQALPALQNPVFTLPPRYPGLAPFPWFIASGLAEAHGFRRPALVFPALSVGVVAPGFRGLYLSDR